MAPQADLLADLEEGGVDMEAEPEVPVAPVETVRVDAYAHRGLCVTGKGCAQLALPIESNAITVDLGANSPDPSESGDDGDRDDEAAEVRTHALRAS
jgi:hypothetical protein